MEIVKKVREKFEELINSGNQLKRESINRDRVDSSC